MTVSAATLIAKVREVCGPRPANDLVLVEVLEGDERVSAGGLVYSARCEKTHKLARVLAVGPGRRAWRDHAGKWHTTKPHEHASVDRWADAPTPIPVRVGERVVIEDWRVQWHSGNGAWPGKGDLALVPSDALVFALDDDVRDVHLDFVKLGVRE